MHRTVALLDCRDTLLIDGCLNLNLIEALQQKKILDIYLFTGTVLMKSKVMVRKQVVQYLQQNGFTVHGVITPLDLAWDESLLEEIKLFNSANKGIFPIRVILPTGKKEDKIFYDFLESSQHTFPKLFKATTQYNSNGKKLGSAFLQAEDELEKYGDISEITQLRSFCLRPITHYLSMRYQYAHVKELLLDLFFRYCPGWVNDVVIADNSIILSTHITKFRPLDDTIFFPPLTMITVKGKNQQIIYYEKILEEHFKKCFPVFFGQNTDNDKIHEKRGTLFTSASVDISKDKEEQFILSLQRK